MRRLALLGTFVAGLLLASTANAKGPVAATIDGPGTGGGISVGGSGEPGSGAPLGNLSDQAGLFPAAFGQTPDPMLAGRPKGDLGPRYTIRYRLPSPNGGESTIRQDLYPYAQGSPVTYTAPGQLFFGTERTRGGWYRAAAALKDTLVNVGLPAQAVGQESPAPRSTPVEDGGTGWSDLWPAFGAAALVLGLTALISLFVRRRQKTATA
jgi:hypothetical protein